VSGKKGIGFKAHGDAGHLASPSLGHYASLSFVVIGKESGVRIQNSEKKQSKLSSFRMLATGFFDCGLETGKNGKTG